MSRVDDWRKANAADQRQRYGFQHYENRAERRNKFFGRPAKGNKSKKVRRTALNPLIGGV